MNGVTAAFCVFMVCLSVSTTSGSDPFFSAECNTRHGKILFRQNTENSVKIGRAALYNVPGSFKEVKLVFFDTRPKDNHDGYARCASGDKKAMLFHQRRR